mgnify:CR=1 FL=1
MVPKSTRRCLTLGLSLRKSANDLFWLTKGINLLWGKGNQIRLFSDLILSLL